MMEKVQCSILERRMLYKKIPEVSFVDDEIVYKSGVTPEEVKISYLIPCINY
jgi:hypothetical protein